MTDRERYINMRKEARRYKRKYLHLLHEQRWIPVDEQVPDTPRDVLLTEEMHFRGGKAKRAVIMAWWTGKAWISEKEDEVVMYPLAWRELPEPMQEVEV